MNDIRRHLKTGLSALPAGRRQPGFTMLIYHRVGGGTLDERDLSKEDFAAQLDVLAGHPVVALDDALETPEGQDGRGAVVITFDDGFAEVFTNAWPLLRDRRLPFTLYLATAYVGGEMSWEASTATSGGSGLSWAQIAEMAGSGLCTLGNHTHRHVRPELLSADELDECSAAIRHAIGVEPHHFAYPWGIVVPEREELLRARFRSAATGQIGRNSRTTDPFRLCRIPVRRTDPMPFFRAKLTRGLLAENLYGQVVRTAKAAGLRA